MAFNGSKFQCLKYGPKEAIKSEYDYILGDLENIIEDVPNTRDLGIIMSSSGEFSDHINTIIKKAKKGLDGSIGPFTRMKKGIVLKDKMAQRVIKGLYIE